MSDALVEQPVVFACQGEALLGMLHQARSSDPSAAGVVVVVGGPQYRAGSHRQFLRLARTLAAKGNPVLRFDVRGMGDSSGSLRNFESLQDDIGAAIDAFHQRHPAMAGVVLYGLCDGASAALLYLAERPDPRVRGLCLVNPWVRSAESQARTTVKHYYARRLREPEFWAKLFKGRVAAKAVSDLLGNLRMAGRPGQAPSSDAAQRPARYQDRMASAWKRFQGEILVALSGDDFTAKEFIDFTAAEPAWAGLWALPNVTRLDLPGADHTLSAVADHQALQSAMTHWLDTRLAPVVA